MFRKDVKEDLYQALLVEGGYYPDGHLVSGRAFRELLGAAKGLALANLTAADLREVVTKVVHVERGRRCEEKKMKKRAARVLLFC